MCHTVLVSMPKDILERYFRPARKMPLVRLARCVDHCVLATGG